MPRAASMPAVRLRDLAPTPCGRAHREMQIYDAMPPEWQRLANDHGLTGEEYETCIELGLDTSEALAVLRGDDD